MRKSRILIKGGLVAGLLGCIVLTTGCPGGGVPGECSTNADCDDGVDCTSDVCNAGICVNDTGGCVPIDVSTASAEVLSALDD